MPSIFSFATFSPRSRPSCDGGRRSRCGGRESFLQEVVLLHAHDRGEAGGHSRRVLDQERVGEHGGRVLGHRELDAVAVEDRAALSGVVHVLDLLADRPLGQRPGSNRAEPGRAERGEREQEQEHREQQADAPLDQADGRKPRPAPRAAGRRAALRGGHGLARRGGRGGGAAAAAAGSAAAGAAVAGSVVAAGSAWWSCRRRPGRWSPGPRWPGPPAPASSRPARAARRRGSARSRASPPDAASSSGRALR